MQLYIVKKLNDKYQVCEVNAEIIVYHAFDCGIESANKFYDETKPDLGFKSYYANCIIDRKLLQEAIKKWPEQIYCSRIQGDYAAQKLQEEDEEALRDLGELIAWDNNRRLADYRADIKGGF